MCDSIERSGDNRSPHQIREFRVNTQEGDVFILDNAADAYLLAFPGDVVEEWVKCSSHVVLEGEA